VTSDPNFKVTFLKSNYRKTGAS